MAAPAPPPYHNFESHQQDQFDDLLQQFNSQSKAGLYDQSDMTSFTTSTDTDDYDLNGGGLTPYPASSSSAYHHHNEPSGIYVSAPPTINPSAASSSSSSQQQYFLQPTASSLDHYSAYGSNQYGGIARPLHLHTGEEQPSPAGSSSLSPAASSPSYLSGSYVAGGRSGSVTSNSPYNFTSPYLLDQGTPYLNQLSEDGHIDNSQFAAYPPFTASTEGHTYAPTTTSHAPHQPLYQGSLNSSTSSSPSTSISNSGDVLARYQAGAGKAGLSASYHPSDKSANNGIGNLSDDQLARLLAAAQAQGQMQAQGQLQAAQHHAMVQAAFNNSYFATLNALPPSSTGSGSSKGGPLLPMSSQSYALPGGGLFGQVGAGGGLSLSGMGTTPMDYTPNHLHSQSQSSSSESAKKRKVIPPPPMANPPPVEQALNASRSRNSLAASTPASHGRPPRSSQGPRRVSIASCSSGSGNGLTLDTSSALAVPVQDGTAFDFSLKSSVSPSTDGGGAPRTSVDLIANAGITSTPDARKVYRAEAGPGAKLAAAPPVTKKAAAAAAKKGKEAAGVDGATGAKKAGEKRKKGEKGHNAVERRYRNNINNAIATLRDIVPALRHLKPLPSMPASRRRASQFTLSTACQAPTPAGLIDGIPAAKTLSKGTILGKAIEYITFLQGARVDGQEDIELFKTVVTEMVAGGPALVAEFEKRRDVREAEREKTRERLRKEQEAIDDSEDGEEGDEEGEEDEDAVAKAEVKSESTSETDMDVDRPPPPRTSSQGTASSSTGFPPSPISSDDQGFSPRVFMTQSPQQHQAGAPPRVLLGAFMGLSFAGGLGYDWTFADAAAAGSEVAGARAWAGSLVRRGTALPPSSSPPANPVLISSDLVDPRLLTGLVFLGTAYILASFVYLLFPLILRSSRKPVTLPRLDPVMEEEQIDKELPRSFYRQQRRAEALAQLAQLDEDAPPRPLYVDECKKALKARRELLRLVGAPTYGLLPALAKEALATALRNITTIRVGSFSTWSEADRLEAAVAWVRIAEIEAAIGDCQIHYLARAYTFLRLFNLSRSKHWPKMTPSTSPANVNAVLALHLDSLGQRVSANALWSQAVKADRKKLDSNLDPWTEIALACDFEQVRATLASTTKKSTDCPSPSDTVPLLRVAEARCESALREAWATIFVACTQTQANLSSSARFSTIVGQPRLEETVRQVLEATCEGSPIHSMAKVTRALCAYYTGSDHSELLARELMYEALTDGPAARLGCARAFFTLVLGDNECRELEAQTPSMEVDILASATLGWLNVTRQSEEILSLASTDLPAVDGGDASREKGTRPPLSPNSRRVLGTKVFTDPSLIAFCASPVADALKFLRAAGLDAGSA